MNGDLIENPGPVRWPWPLTDEDAAELGAPSPHLTHDCGCHLRRPDYEAVLCDEHLAELNRRTEN
jgi:hypothetical protein